jgi:sulfide:quinone oxidoreductase
MSKTPFRVVIAGGGVAGLEALLALHAQAANHVKVTLISPDDQFSYRPLAVAEPFALGTARRTPLSDAVRDADAAFVHAAVTGVDVDQRTLTTSDGRTVEYDALVLALGAASEPAFAHAFTWDDTSEIESLGGRLRDLEEGYTKRFAIVVPPGPGWPLPAYELALLIAGQARGMGVTPEITLVTPEQAPLAIFGPRAVELVSAELVVAGVRVELGAYAAIEHDHATTIRLRPSGRSIEVDRVLALPRLRGRAPTGVPADAEGFIIVDEHCRVVGAEHVWAAGDGIAFPVKFGGLAAEQADAAAADIAGEAGALVERKPFRPVLRGQLLTGHGPRYMRYDAAGGGGEGQATANTLWWPPSKVAGRYLSPWLANRDDEAVAGQLPRVGGLSVQTDLYREFIAS